LELVVESPTSDRNIQKPPGHCAKKSALGDPAWAQGPDDLKRSLPTSTLLWFCNETQGNALKWRLQHKAK